MRSKTGVPNVSRGFTDAGMVRIPEANIWTNSIGSHGKFYKLFIVDESNNLRGMITGVLGTTSVMIQALNSSELILTSADDLRLIAASTKKIYFQDGGTGEIGYIDKNEMSVGTKKIINVVDPTSDQDAATKKYADLGTVLQFTRVMTAAFGDVAYTGIGFKPKRLIISAIDGAAHSLGFGDSALNQNQHFTNYAATLAGSSNFLIVDLKENATPDQQYAVLKSMDSDGFTLTWTKVNSPTGTTYLNVMAF